MFAQGRAASGGDLLKLACGRSREEVASTAILAVLADRPVIHRDELVLFE
ncbi:MAG: hypothetical protein ACLUVF_10770 [Adlercreutzia sp.]